MDTFLKSIRNNTTELVALGIITATIALVPVSFAEDVGTTQAQQETINKLYSQSPSTVALNNERLKEVIEDAVTGLAEIDSSRSEIEQAERALSNGNTQLAIALYRADANRKKEIGEEALQAAAASFRRLGALIFLNYDERDNARIAYLRSLDLWPDNIDAWNQLGFIQNITGPSLKAIEAFEQVSRLSETSDNQQSWSAIRLGTLGTVYQYRGERDRAIELYEQALAINQTLDRKEGIANNYSNLADTMQFVDTDQGIELTEKALEIYQEIGHELGIAASYDRLGFFHREQGDIEQIMEFYEKSAEINQARGDKRAVSGTYVNMAYVYFTQGNIVRVRELQEKSIDTGFPNASAYQTYLEDLSGQSK